MAAASFVIQHGDLVDPESDVETQPFEETKSLSQFIMDNPPSKRCDAVELLKEHVNVLGPEIKTTWTILPSPPPAPVAVRVRGLMTELQEGARGADKDLCRALEHEFDNASLQADLAIDQWKQEFLAAEADVAEAQLMANKYSDKCNKMEMEMKKLMADCEEEVAAARFAVTTTDKCFNDLQKKYRKLKRSYLKALKHMDDNLIDELCLPRKRVKSSNENAPPCAAAALDR